MTRRGRGSTGPGRPTALPAEGYDPPDPRRELPDGRRLVAFHGDDGRRRVFDVSALPLAGWHEALAAAVAQRTGPLAACARSRPRPPDGALSPGW
jgi:hypothetical protein